MAYLDQDEYFPTWLPHWLPEDLVEEIYLGMQAAAPRTPALPPDDSDLADGYIIPGWFGPFLLSPCTYFLRGTC